MFKRTYFFSVESLPCLRDQRRKEGKVTQCTGFVEIRSLRVDTERLRSGILSMLESEVESFNKDEIILTQLSKI